MTRARIGERCFVGAAVAFLVLTWWGVVLAEVGMLRLETWLLPSLVLGGLA